MKQQRAPFMPVTNDIDDDRLDQLAAAKGVGALVKPQPATTGAGQGAAPQASPSPVPKTASAALVAPEATPRARMKTINLELPDYVWTELKIRSAHEQVSVRHLIMCALVKDGVTIRDTDMVEDGRRLRGGRAD